MLRKILAASVIFASVCSTNAFAQGYYGFSYSRVDLDGAEPGALDIKIGALLNDYLAVEGRLALPLVSDSVDFFGTEIDIDADYLGAMAKLGTFSNVNSFYIAAGMLDVTIEASAGGSSADDSANDLVYGVGMELGEDSGFALEYLSGTGDLEDITWLNIGYFNRFD